MTLPRFTQSQSVALLYKKAVIFIHVLINIPIWIKGKRMCECAICVCMVVCVYVYMYVWLYGCMVVWMLMMISIDSSEDWASVWTIWSVYIIFPSQPCLYCILRDGKSPKICYSCFIMRYTAIEKLLLNLSGREGPCTYGTRPNVIVVVCFMLYLHLRF